MCSKFFMGEITTVRHMLNTFAVSVWFLTQISQTFGQNTCFEDQKLNLLQLKDSLKYNSSYSTKLIQWNQTPDCCAWPGVSCDSHGAVAALDLSDDSIFDGLDHSTALTSLTSLQSLNLSRNSFITQKIPSFIHKLTTLTELNLGSTNLSGPINDSLANLRFLSKLRLDGNFFLTPIPLFLANFTNMKMMHLNNSFWIGEFPEAIFHMKSLQGFTVAKNNELRGKLPEFHSNSSIQQLVVTGTRFGGTIPMSIGNLPLVNLKLDDCQFTGELPRSLFNLSELIVLKLHSNNLTGFVDLDWVINLPYLSFLSLSDNLLTVKENTLRLDQLIYLDLNQCNMKNFPFLSNQSVLELLYLRGNHLQGSIPSSLPTTLVFLDLSINNFTSSIPADVMGKLTSLGFLRLQQNSLRGEIPSSLCNALSLMDLFLGRNNLQGSIPECLFQDLSNLVFFDIGYNNITGSIPDTFPKGCMMQTFSVAQNLIEGSVPLSLANCKRLQILDLSNNKIFDTFPCQLMDLSELSLLHLLGNMLHGDISCIGDWPNLQTMLLLSNNYTSFTAFYNSTSMARLKSLFYLNLGYNQLEGTIPSALCSLAEMETLELGRNNLHGTIPECLVKNLTALRALNLEVNSISGSIPNVFHDSCEIQFLGVSFNDLEGPVPKSLAKCARLEILEISYNKIRDQFPCHLKKSSMLKALTLRSNRFYGGVECIGSKRGGWKSLRIIDISMNKFSGVLPSNSFAGWDAAIKDSNGNYNGIHIGALHNQTIQYRSIYTNNTLTANKTLIYEAGITVTTKGLDVLLGGTIGVFCTIDFSSNQFNGPIPESIGLLSALNSVNLSYNAFSGGIPSSIGNLSYLESLDLSNNRLSGNIPLEFVNLRFLQHLNVSMNHLEGRVPTGIQMQSFPQSSYQENKGVCGPPLKNLCYENGTWSGDAPPSTSKDEIGWYLESTALGFVAGWGLLLWILVFVKSWKVWYNEIINSFVSKLVGK